MGVAVLLLHRLLILCSLPTILLPLTEVLAQQPLLRLPFPETGYQHTCVQGPHAQCPDCTHNLTSTENDVDLDTPNPDQDLTPEAVLAAADGTAYACHCPSPCPKTGFGNNVRVSHANGLFTLYAHLASIAITSGTNVSQGQTIGFEDSTGRSQGDHIHFGIHQGNAADCSSVGTSVEIERIEVIDPRNHTGPVTIRGRDFLCDQPNGEFHWYISTNPRPVVIPGLAAPDGLTITASEFVIGATLTARFRFHNQSDVPITLRNIVVGGRLNGVDDCSNYPGTCPDFSQIPGPIVIGPGATYDYFGTFEPILAGRYKFDIYWRIPNDQTDMSYGWMFGPPVNPPSLRNEFASTILAVCTAPLQARGGCVQPSPTVTRVPSQRPTPTLVSATPISTFTARITSTAATNLTATFTASPHLATTPSPVGPCPDDGNPCTEELLVDGICTHRTLPNFRSCNDGSFCNGLDLCHDGICGGPGWNTGAACPAPDGDADCSESCDEAAQTCTAPDPDGSPCTDSVFCNGADLCAQGTCSRHMGDPCANGGQPCNQALDECAPTTEIVSPTPTPIAGEPCVGDCSDDGQVTVDELVRGVGIALGSTDVGRCSAFDCHRDGSVTVDCLVLAVNVALSGCSIDVTPIPSATLLGTATPLPRSPTDRPIDTATPPATPEPSITVRPTPILTISSVQFCRTIADGGICEGEISLDHRFNVGETISVLAWYTIENGPVLVSFSYVQLRPDGTTAFESGSFMHQAGVGTSRAPNWDADVQLYQSGVFRVKFFAQLPGREPVLMTEPEIHVGN